MKINRNNFVNGLIALCIISAIALGCTCNQEDGFKFGDDKAKEATPQPESTTGPDDGNTGSDVTFKADAGTVPTTEQNRALVLKTLNDFNEAVKKKDFADFRETVARRWRNTTKVEKFNEGFKQFIDKQVDISRVNGSVPDFDPQPRINKKYNTDVLFLKGKYNTSPLPVRFNLEYIIEDDEWKLVFISVDTRK